MGMKIKLTHEQLDLLNMGSKVITKDMEVFYYFPYWIKEVNDEYELINPENIPEGLKQQIKDARAQAIKIKR